ncbi:MAG: outer membrane protein assembly factor BamD [Rhodobacteraceae bacterium]|nr:outer membrane protein assembly factor BamD [Paracoccaceae bacterium]
MQCRNQKFLAAFRHAVLPVIAALLLTACSQDEEDRFEGMSAERIFRQAESTFGNGDFVEAAEIYEEVERLYPYSDWSRRGTIMAAYAYGEAGEYEKSRSAAERFLSSYPGDEDAAYAQYLVGMSYFRQLGARGRDQANTTKALEGLQLVMEQYPESDYAESAGLKFDLAVNHLASKEMEVGRYYLKRGNFTAAINRFQYVVDNYGTTAQVPEALHRLVEAYLSLGLVGEARETAIVLGHNFGASDWYASTHRLFTSRGLKLPETVDGDEGLLRQFYRRTVKGEWI